MPLSPLPLVQQPTIDFETIFMSCASEKGSDPVSIEKINEFVVTALGSIKSFCKDYMPGKEFSNFECVQSNDKSSGNMYGLKLKIYIYDTDKVDPFESSNRGRTGEIHIRESTLRSLPRNLTDLVNFDHEEMEAYEVLYANVVRTILQLIGAHRSNYGLMSGLGKFAKLNPSTPLVEVLDDISARIVSGFLSIQKALNIPVLYTQYNTKKRQLFLKSAIEIVLLVFIKDDYYTEAIWFPNNTEFKKLIPRQSSYDFFLIQFSDGSHRVYFPPEETEQTQDECSMSLSLPELVHKPTIKLQTVFLPSASGKSASTQSVKKVDQIVNGVLNYIQSFCKDFCYDGDYSTFEYSSIQLKEEPPVYDESFKFIVYVEDCNVDGQIKAFVQGHRGEVHIQNDILDFLPSDLTDYTKLGTEEMKKIELLWNYFLHEILHLLGAQHSRDGIMSGSVELFDTNHQIKPLIYIVDDITAGIVFEVMTDHVWSELPYADVSYDPETRQISLSADLEIATIVFIKETKYTDVFYSCNDKEINAIAPLPSEWDTVFIQFVYGGYMVYKQDALLTTLNCACRHQ